ncbi:S-layer homology domain-containing protein [Bifidobacterium myosotis]|uniref:SLH domain-containing protein n=1 Tax=Bifidobacterium myosotis TaxID=1630166 RepID=A0A5M9ZG22_9BIFI|nr:S-layer homology domain-containing protein [Bifidobacterium myosotis]KAA8825460.1 hypothetical protein EMO91_12300 [Bifidobacterium myosotis]
MTGNTKVWRAPLAGLASVAMIATMGVAASTANADTKPSWTYGDVTVTLDANGGKFSDGSTTYAYTDPSRVSHDYADGVYPDLYTTVGTKGVPVWSAGVDGKASRVFSGWYTQKNGGQAVDPDAALTDGTVLYAHYSASAVGSDESEELVTFNLQGQVEYADADTDSKAGDVVNISGDTVSVRLADDDTIADWQVPSKDVPNNGQLFTQWSKTSGIENGDVLTPETTDAVTVEVKGDNGFTLYQDGKQVSGNDTVFDAATGSKLTGFQAVKNNGSSAKLLATDWNITPAAATSNGKFVFDETTLPAADSSISHVTITPGTDATASVALNVYTTGIEEMVEPDQTFFVPQDRAFTGKLAEPKQPNVTFEGWYERQQPVSVQGWSGVNQDFFKTDGSLILFNKDAAPWKKADPIQFGFTTVLSKDTTIYAVYEANAKHAVVTFDPNYDGANPINVTYNEGDKIKDKLPQVTRDGYTLEGWYTVNPSDPEHATNYVSYKLDENAVASSTGKPNNNYYFARWTPDSKYGVNGLLANLARGYATGVSDKGYASFTNSPSQPKALKETGKDEKDVTLYDKTTKDHEDADYHYVLENPGYVETTWNAFVKSRNEDVLPALIKELNLAKDADIATVYQAVKGKLSAEKADQFNRLFSSVASDSASFPDVNYDDFGTHSDEITKLYKKGIVKGYQDGTFGYGASLARVDYIVWLYRAAGSPDADASAAGFSDVNAATVPEPTFRKAIAWAKSTGVTEGYSDGTFAPYAPLNRQDAMAFLYRAAGSPKYNEDYADVKFADVTPGDTANHSQAVLWAAHNNIAKGYSGSVNRFGGYNTLVRQDAAAFLARTLDAHYIAK